MVNSCEVVGCNNQKSNKGLAFFSLPTDRERRKKWLMAIDRLDLIDKKAKCHFVCALHFAATQMKFIPQLLPDAIPIKLLPNQPTSSQTNESYINDSRGENSNDPAKKSLCSTTGEETKNYSTQTLALSTDTPSKRKLCDNLTISDRKRRKLHNELNKIKKELQSHHSECYNNFTCKCEDEICQRFLKLLKYRSNRKNRPKETQIIKDFDLYALKLYFYNPQTYRCLQSFLRFPKESTLERLYMLIPPKFEDNILSFLSAKLKSLPEKAKYCTLCVDQMVLKSDLHYDTKKGEMIGLHNINGKVSEEIASYACVIMLRGIVENWQQPIAYSFLASPKYYDELETWIDEIIVKLSGIGIEIKAIVSDQCSNFEKYAKEVNEVTPEKPYFLLNGKKIYYIFDVPHLIKSIRNNLITSDFVYDNQQISWKYIEDMFSIKKGKDLKIIPKVTEKHIRPNNFQKMRIKYAAQIFSISVYTAIDVLVRCDSLPKEAKYTAVFVEKMNYIFDVLNLSKVSFPHEYQKAISLKQFQIDLLKEAAIMFENIKAINKSKGENTIKRIKTFRNTLITMKSILMLRRDLEEIGIKFLFTRRLNQEPLAKFFETIRRQDGIYRNPTPIQFIRAYSKLFFSNMMITSSSNSYSQEDICQLFQKEDLFEKPKYE